MIVTWFIMIIFFIWNDYNYLKTLDFLDTFLYGSEPTYKYKIGFNTDDNNIRSVEIYPVKHPIGFLKSWEK